MRLVSNKLEKIQNLAELEDCAAELTRLVDRRRFKNDLLVWLTASTEEQSREAVGHR